MTFDDVRRIALALPEAEERLTWDTDITFRVRDKIFAIGGEGADRVSIKADLETQAELTEMDPSNELPEHVRRNRAEWDGWAADFVANGEVSWRLAPGDEQWGIWDIPEREL